MTLPTTLSRTHCCRDCSAKSSAPWLLASAQPLPEAGAGSPGAPAFGGGSCMGEEVRISAALLLCVYASMSPQTHRLNAPG